MKCSNIGRVPIFLIQILTLIFISSNAFSKPDLDGFFRCLENKSNPKIPVSKAVYTQKNSSYSSVLQAYIRNLRFNTSATPKPLAIVTALDASHVQATILCAKAHDLEVRIRSGGHDYEGLSYVSAYPFIVLDLFNLRSIDIDFYSKTAWIESGATVGELYYKIANHSNSHAFPAAVGLTVGIGGHFSGGGYGTLLRKFGLTVDHIIDARIVDVNGRILDKSGMGEDLFWAIRGGGAASFCVVLAWKIKLVRIPETVTVFNVQKTLKQGVTDIFYQWQHVAPNIDNDLFIRAQSEVSKDASTGKKTVQVSFIAIYLGKAEALIKLMSKSFPLLGLQSKNCVETRWIESTLFFNGIPKGTPLEILLDRKPYYKPTYDKHKSDYAKTPIPKSGLEIIWKKMIELENVTLQFNPYGGKMNEIPEDATPFPHRAGNVFKIQYLSVWQNPDDTPKQLDTMKEMYNTMEPYMSHKPREAFLNYRDLDIGTNANRSIVFAQDYFKGNLKRLLKVKVAVDPENFFRNEQSIHVVPGII